MTERSRDLLMVNVAGLFSIYRRLVLIALLLLAAHGIAMLLKYGLGFDIFLGFVPLFDFYEEKNIPTYFSSINLLFTAGLIFLVIQAKSHIEGSFRVAWKILGAGFLFMSIDEFCDLRMVLKTLGKAAMESSDVVTSSGFSVAWTIPISGLVILLGLYFIPFLRSLPRFYSINFLLAGGMFVLAAIGLENVQGFHVAQTGGIRDIYFMLLVTVEETIEIGSILYFQYFLVRYLGDLSRGDSELLRT